MEIQTTHNGDQTILNLSGRLDTTTAPKLQEALIPVCTSSKSTVLNFADLSYVSSAGLRVLLSGEKTSKSKGNTMKLTNVSSEIMDVFEMTGFSSILNIE